MSTTEESNRTNIPDDRVSLPLVSVVVPTRNRASHLPYLFAALGSQTYPAARMEFVVVDNASTDGTAELVAEWAEALPSPLRYHRKENDGQTASRNVGSALARGDVLAFTDSDCIPDPHWISNAVRHLEQADVVAGPMVGLMSSADGVAMLQFKSVLHDDGTYPTGNLFISRDRFQTVGGFDERFGLFPWGNPKAGEDTDLVWRARRSGADVTFADDVVVGHQPAPPPRLTQSLLVPVVVQIFPYLVRSIPELREVKFHRRYFLDKQHMYFDMVVLGTVLGLVLRRRLPLALSVPWLRMMAPGIAREARSNGPAAAARLAGLILYHAIGNLAVLTVASARYRRLVL